MKFRVLPILASSGKIWWALIGLTLARFAACVDITIVNTAIPYIQDGLGVSLSTLQWVMTAFFLSLSACMTIMGRLGDAHGHRRLFYGGLLGFSVGLVLAGIAPNSAILIIARVIQGIGCAITFPASGALVSHTFEGRRRGTAIGIYYGLSSAGLAAGPVIGSLLLTILNWRWIFFINVPVTIVALLICLPTVVEYRSKESIKIDWLGSLILLIGIVALITALVEGPILGWSTALVITLFAITAISIAILLWHSNRIKYPIIDFALFHCRQFGLCQFSLAAVAAFYALALFLIPLYLFLIRNEDALTIGLMLLSTTGSMAICSLLFGRAIAHCGEKWFIVVGLGLLTAAAVMQLFFTSSTPPWFVATALLIFGVGWAAVLGPSTVAALESVPKSKTGLALGTSWTLQNLGAALGLAIGTSLYHWQAQAALNQHGHEGEWIAAAVADPGQAAHIISTGFKVSMDQAQAIFGHSFQAGYRAAMWLLVGITAVLSMIEAVGLIKRQNGCI